MPLQISPMQTDTDIMNLSQNSNDNLIKQEDIKIPDKKDFKLVLSPTSLIIVGGIASLFVCMLKYRSVKNENAVLIQEKQRAFGLYDDLQLIATNDTNVISKVQDNINALNQLSKELEISKVSTTRELTEEEKTKNKNKMSTADWLNFASSALNSLTTGIMGGLSATGSLPGGTGMAGSSSSLTSLFSGLLSSSANTTTQNSNKSLVIDTSSKTIGV